MKRFFTWKRLLRFTGVMVLLTVLLPLSVVASVRYRCSTTLQQVKDKIAAKDPNWELDDLVKEYNSQLPPDDKNPYMVADLANRSLPANFDTLSSNLPNTRHVPVNCLYAKNDLAAYEQMLLSCDPSLQIARKMVGMPEGGRTLAFPRNPMTAQPSDAINLHTVALLLSEDAVNHAMHNRPNEAVTSARAAFGVPRAIGSEPSAVGQMVRISTDVMAVRSVERLLNLCEPKEGLAELQADLLQQSKFPYVSVTLRSERAVISRLFDILDSGEILDTPGGTAVFGLSINKPSEHWRLRLRLPMDHANCLGKMNEYVSLSQLPPPPQESLAVIRWIRANPQHDTPYKMSAPMLTALATVSPAAYRIQSKLVAASVAVACERYRLKFGKWPESLQKIPKDILPEIPLDPFSGRPILYRGEPDSILVYSIGPEGNTDCMMYEERIRMLNDKDCTVKVFAPSLRRQPAPPPTERSDDQTAEKP